MDAKSLDTCAAFALTLGVRRERAALVWAIKAYPREAALSPAVEIARERFRSALENLRLNGGADRAPPDFKDWLARQLENPPDDRLRPFFQSAWDECIAADWRMKVISDG